MTLRQTQLDLLRRLVDISNALADKGTSYEFVVDTSLGGTDLDFLWSQQEGDAIDGVSTSDINELRSRGFLRLVGAKNYEATNKAFEMFRDEEVLGYATGSVFKTGDEQLDELLESAITRYKLADAKAHRDAIEKLWDAWERLKTLEPGNKKVSTKALLDRAATEETFRELLEAESGALTKMGNDFPIRHHETDRPELADSAQVDYFFERLYAMIRLLLKKSDRA